MYYPNTNAILYVVDSHDKQRFSKAGEELSKVLDVLFAYPERDTTRRSSPDSSKQAGFARRFF